MLHLYVIVTVLGNIFLRNVAGTCLYKTDSEDPPKPELSTTFLEGYWYEQFYTNTLLKNNSCSHFEINCNSTTSTCEVLHEIWQAYLLKQLWNGTIVQNNSQIIFIINSPEGNSTVFEDVHLKYDKNSVLLWACQETELVFASVLLKMDTDDQMEEVWDTERKDQFYPQIIDGTAAGIWKRNDPSNCRNGGQFNSSNLLIMVLLLMCGIRKLQI